MVAAFVMMAVLAQATPAPAQPLSEVTVTAPSRPAPPTIQAARDFVAAVARPTGAHDQLARFEDPICPKVEGFDPPYDATVAADVRRIAKEAGARIDGPGCAPNLVIVLAADIEAVMSGLYARRWDILDGEDASGPSMRRFTQTRRPIAVWRTTAARSWTGAPPSNQGDPDAPPTYTDARASHIQSNVIDAVSRVLVVIDGAKIKGLTLGQVADYAAFAALGGADLDAKTGPASILGLFDASPSPTAPRLRLTAWDRAYLRATFLVFSDRRSYLQEAQMASQIMQDLRPVVPSGRTR